MRLFIALVVIFTVVGMPLSQTFAQGSKKVPYGQKVKALQMEKKAKKKAVQQEYKMKKKVLQRERKEQMRTGKKDFLMKKKTLQMERKTKMRALQQESRMKQRFLQGEKALGLEKETMETKPAPVFIPPVVEAQKPVTVAYSDAGFSPESATIKAGDSVTFTAQGSQDMWVASATHPTHEVLPEFDQRSLGGTYSFTFSKPGTWRYHNHVRPAHRGTVIVE